MATAVQSTVRRIPQEKGRPVPRRKFVREIAGNIKRTRNMRNRVGGSVYRELEAYREQLVEILKKVIEASESVTMDMPDEVRAIMRNARNAYHRKSTKLRDHSERRPPRYSSECEEDLLDIDPEETSSVPADAVLSPKTHVDPVVAAFEAECDQARTGIPRE